MEKIIVAFLFFGLLLAVQVQGENASEKEDTCTEAGFFPSSKSCKNFYRCVDWHGNGQTISKFDFTCGAGTYWDTDILTCNHKRAINRPECSDGQDDGGSTDDPAIEGSTDGSVTGTAETEPSTGEETTADSSIDSTDGETTTVLPSEVTDSVGSESQGAYTLICDKKVRRHPTYCDKYYTCNLDDGFNAEMETCPDGTVYLEENEACGEPGPEDAECKRAPSQPDATTAAVVEDTTITPAKVWKVSEDSTYPCTDLGYFPSDQGCSLFHRCIKEDEETLKGLMYQCPDDHSYSDEEKWCVPNELAPTCDLLRLSEQLLKYLPVQKLKLEELEAFFTSSL